MRRLVPLTVALALLSTAPAATASVPPGWQPLESRATPAALPAAAPVPAGTDRVSDERSRTVWAHPRLKAPVVARPRPGARRTARLHPRTEDGFREVYLVLERSEDASGITWLRIRLPARPNGQTGWVRARALGRLNTVRTRLLIDRRALRATFFRNGRRVWSTRVGIGAPGTPTPRGRFWVREAFSVRGRTIYGPYAIGTSAYSVLSDWPGGGVVGIHGTNQPSLIPGRPSHGCIRMRNHDITWLVHRMPLGTPIRIR